LRAEVQPVLATITSTSAHSRELASASPNANGAKIVDDIFSKYRGRAS